MAPRPTTSARLEPPFPVEELRSVYRYDFETGQLLRKSKGQGCWGCSVAPRALKTRRVISLKGHRVLHSRAVWYFHTGQWPGDLDVDHINGDWSDDRIGNLRLLPRGDNTLNNHNPRAKPKSADLPVGVYRVRNSGFKVCLGAGKQGYARTLDEALALRQSFVEQRLNRHAP